MFFHFIINPLAATNDDDNDVPSATSKIPSNLPGTFQSCTPVIRMQVYQAPVPPQFEGSPSPRHRIPCAQVAGVARVAPTVPSWAAWCVPDARQRPPALPVTEALARGKRSDVRGCARRGAPQFSGGRTSTVIGAKNLSQDSQETMEGRPWLSDLFPFQQIDELWSFHLSPSSPKRNNTCRLRHRRRHRQRWQTRYLWQMRNTSMISKSWPALPHGPWRMEQESLDPCEMHLDGSGLE